VSLLTLARIMGRLIVNPGKLRAEGTRRVGRWGGNTVRSTRATLKDGASRTGSRGSGGGKREGGRNR
jgi:hypothetical protein